jgi:adhesin transport system outer membrane protein
MTLEEAASLAIRTNPEVGVVANDRSAVNEELRQARALYYPQIDLRADTGPEYAKNRTTEFIEEEDDAGRTAWRSDASLTLSQLLFDGFFADSEVERQQARLRSAAFRVGESAEATALDAVEAYLEVLRHRERLTLAEENVRAHQETLADVERRATGGGGNIGDVRQAQARLASAESARTIAQGDLADAEALFIRVIGQAPDDLMEPGSPSVPATLEEAIQTAIANSPTVALARADVDTADAEIKQQEASLYPDLRLELNGTVNDNADGRDTTDYAANALLVLRWNLYRGGADVARIREFKYRAESARDQLRVNERRVEEEVRRSWNAVQVSQNNVQVLQQEATANQQTRDVYRQQFDIGQRGLLDILDSTNDVYLSQDSLVTAEYTNLFAVYRLLASAGLLRQTLGVAETASGAVPTASTEPQTTTQ